MANKITKQQIADLQNQGFTVLSNSQAARLSKTIDAVKSATDEVVAALEDHDPREVKSLARAATKLSKQASKLTV